MNKSQKRVRDREITRMQRQRREVKMSGAVVPEELPSANTDKVARKSVAIAARIARRDPPSQATAAALVELVSSSSASVKATVPELPDLTAEAESDWSEEREQIAVMNATHVPFRLIPPGSLDASAWRPRNRFARFLIWLNLFAVRLRLRSRRTQKALPKAIAQ